MKESAFTRKTLLVLVALFSLYAVATKAFARVDDEHAGGEEGRVYVMSNAAAGNTVIVFHRDEDGSLLRIQEVQMLAPDLTLPRTCACAYAHVRG